LADVFLKKVMMLLSNEGIESDVRIINEAKSLIGEGFKISCLVWSRSGRKGVYRYQGITIKRIPLVVPFEDPRFGLFFYIMLFNLIAFFELLMTDFDIVHCNDFDTLFPGFFAAKLRRKKLVYDAHEIYSLMTGQYLSPKVVRILVALEFWLAEHVDALITVNAILVRYFSAGICNAKKVHLVMNFKNQSEFEISEETIRSFRKNHRLIGRFVVLYTGWLVPGNGLEELFSALELLDSSLRSKLSVLVCGNGFAEGHLKGIVKSKHLGDCVHFIGKINSKEVPLFVNSSDIAYIVYSKSVDYSSIRTPSRLFEAILCGKPVLASNFGELAAIVKRSKIGLTVDPEEVTEISAALSQMMQNPSLLAMFHQNALLLAQVYNWSSEEKKLIGLYESL
jgi:glycosyltransferase involved in cell wall biosynthesis